MKRRDFLGVLGGAAAWPVTARAQQPPVMLVIGFLHTGSLNAFAASVLRFRTGLKARGYIEDHNVSIEYRWANGHYDRLPALAADLVNRHVVVIAAVGGSVAAQAAKGATSGIPIVFQGGGDPVKEGLVASLARPGGNMTGVNLFTNELAAKRLALLHELVPKASSVAVLINPTNPNAEPQLREVERAASALKLSLHVLRASSEQEFDAAFQIATRDSSGALLVNADPLFTGRRETLAALSAQYAIPTMYGLREHTEAGGLISYSASLDDIFEHVGDYVGRILNGEKPADLPVLQPTKFELVINLKTAKRLALPVPPTLLARADVVIE